ncbi:MAG: hypothetical protein CME64_02865 [Halobacteriovoraceae bacterium]|nr:hypothetical protein [Halobacteriovoraceae bacterium]|tara:strand:- start:29327 stop:30205 length:879 start_codon:yes stop_codon:yes gene_type:complete
MFLPYLVSTFTICLLAFFFLEKLPLFDLNSKAWPLKEKGHGQKLYRELLSLNRAKLASGKSIELTRYKFFTELLDELLVSYKQTGANIFGHIGELRKNLLKDIKYEKRLSGARGSSLAEMGMIFGMSALFTIFATSYAEIQIEGVALIFAFGWQALGVGLFLFALGKLRQKHFRPFQGYLKAASFLDIFIKTGQPVNIIAKKLALSSLIKDKSLDHLEDRMEMILEQIKSQGIYDSAQGAELGAECWYCYEEKLDRFFQEIKRLKLLVITLFFLGSYLFIFFSLVGALQQGH